MEKFHLNTRDNQEIHLLLGEITNRYKSVENPEFQRNAVVLAHELPRRLRTALAEFKLYEPAGSLIIAGIDIDDSLLGPTPGHWHEQGDGTSPALREEVLFFLCSQILGEPIAWATQQNGLVMHNLLPIKGHEKEQIGSGSETLLTWHTEEAFHPNRADYIALMCLRNPDDVETTFADVGDLDISEADAEILRRDLFAIRPDESHLNKNRSSVLRIDDSLRNLVEKSYRWIQDLNENPPLRSVLFGSADRPYLCIDPYFMEAPADPEAAAVLTRLCDEIDRKIKGVALQRGEIIFIDNFRAVHGRKPFKARFDGTDRWLKRLNIARDLRPSRGRRPSAANRILY